jgi:pyruvate-ferredoxin/flavodoxin oxidoreductase
MLTRRPPIPAEAPAFVRQVLGPMIAGEGDALPVSALPCPAMERILPARPAGKNATLRWSFPCGTPPSVFNVASV